MSLHPGSVLRLLGFICLFMAAIMLLPAIVCAYYGERDGVEAFALTILAMVVFSVCSILYAARSKELRISRRDSFLAVTLAWVVLSLFGALPYHLTGALDSFCKCFFESMSGFSAAGASIMTDIDGRMKGLLFWRSMTNWIGGMGVVLLFIAVLPALGVRGSTLYEAEIVGPVKEKLMPRMRDTAIVLWGIYIGLSVLQILFLMLGGLDWFEAMTIMFATMGSAGFAPHDASIAYYGSMYVDIVCIVFMFLAGVNFSLFFRVLEGEPKRMFRDGEFRLYCIIVLTSTVLVAMNLFSNGLMGAGEALHHAAFQVVSFMSTTGFVSTDYGSWPLFSQCVLYVLCYIGGCAGSTGGGMKVVRIGAMVQAFRAAITRRIHPTAMVRVHVGGIRFDSTTIQAIAGFVAFYFANVLLGTLVLSLTDLDFVIVHSASLMALGNIGMGFGGLGTSVPFSVFPDWALWFLSFLMLAGRLELFTVYSLFTRDFWKR